MSDRKVKRVKRFLKPPPLSVRNALFNQNNAQQNNDTTKEAEESKNLQQKKDTTKNKGKKSNAPNEKSGNMKTNSNVVRQNKNSQSSASNGKKTISVKQNDTPAKRDAVANVAEESSPNFELSESDTEQILKKLENLSIASRLQLKKLIPAQATTGLESGSEKSCKSENSHEANNSSFADDSTSLKLDDAAANNCSKADNKCKSIDGNNFPGEPKQQKPQNSPESGKKGRKPSRSEGKTDEQLSKPSHGREQDQNKSKKSPKTGPGCSSKKTFDANEPINDRQNSMADQSAYKSPGSKGAIPKRNTTRTARPPHNRAERQEPCRMPPLHFDEDSRVPPLHYDQYSQDPPLYFEGIKLGPHMELEFEEAQLIFCMDSENEGIIPVDITSDIDGAATVALATSALASTNINTERNSSSSPTKTYNYLGKTGGEKSPEMQIWARADQYRGDFDTSRSCCHRHKTEETVSSTQTQTVPHMQSRGNQVDPYGLGVTCAHQFASALKLAGTLPGHGYYVDPVVSEFERRVSREIVRAALCQVNTALAIPEDGRGYDDAEPEHDRVQRGRNRRVKRTFGKRCPCKDVAPIKTTYNPAKFVSRSLFDALRKIHHSSDRLMANLPDVDWNRYMILAEQLQRDELKSLEETERMTEYAERMISRMEAELGITESDDELDAQSFCTVDLQDELKDHDDISIASTFTGAASNDEELPMQVSLYEAELIRAYRKRNGIVVIYDPEEFFAIKADCDRVDNEGPEKDQDDDENREDKLDQNSSKKNRGKEHKE